MTETELLEAGYREFAPTYPDGCTRAWQKVFRKTVDDYTIKRYFITVQQYILLHFGIAYEANVQFTTQDDITFNTKMLYSQDITVEDMEVFFECLFVSMGCKDYD